MRKAALMLLMIALFLAGCAPAAPVDTQETHQLTVGFSQLVSESDWRRSHTQSIQDAALQADIRLMLSTTDLNQKNQIMDIRSFIAYQVDAIIMTPCAPDGWDNVLMEAKEAGIPVLVTDRPITTGQSGLYAGFVGGDALSEGIKAARFLKEKTGPAPSCPLCIAEITGSHDSSATRLRSQGFYQELKDDPRFEIVSSIPGDFLRSKGSECMRTLLDKHSKIDVLFSHNDAMTLGAMEAITARGLAPGEDITIISIGAKQEAVDLLKEGKINCLVGNNPLVGNQVMDLVSRLISGQDIPPVTYINEGVYSQFDADLATLPERGY